MLRRTSMIVLLCLSLVAAACTDSVSSAEPAGTTEAPTSTAAAETTQAASSDESVDEGTADTDESALDASLAFAFEIIDGRELTEAEYSERFSDGFQDLVPFTLFSVSSAQVAGLGPWTVGEELDRDETNVGVDLTSSDGDSYVLALEIAAPDDPTIVFLDAIRQPETPDLAGFDEGVTQLAKMGTVRLATFETTGGSCEVINEANADEQMPLGSVFKLYVLGAVVTAVGAGEISWDDDVEVREELDSIPSGTTQNEEPGTMLTVRELADRMIAISDNTATDHLIDLVGRDEVEAALVDYGHATPESNRPFLTTKEFTILKFGSDDEVRAAFAAADEAGRRAILAELSPDLPPVADIVAVTDPVDVETLEWFATPADICRVMTALRADATASDVMANPGMLDTAELFSYIGFKGGSEPGVIATAWAVETPDGRSFVVSGAVSNEDDLIDQIVVFGLLGALLEGVADSR